MKTQITMLVFMAIFSLNLFSTNFTVTNNLDAGAGSLRQAITDANADLAVPHTITFDASYTIALASALPTPGKAMTIDGGANTIVISGYSVSGNSLTVSSNVTLTKLTFDRALVSFGVSSTSIANYCTFKNGNAGGLKASLSFTANNCTFDSNSTTATTLGSAIYGNTTSNVITLNDCVVSNNTSSIGPAIYVTGGAATSALTLKNCIVKNNTNTSTTVYGGGIATSAIVSITNSQISGNTCAHRGAGIALLIGNTTYKSKLTMLNSTVSGNTASLFDGGICIQGSSTNVTDAVTFTNCTISGNSATSGGGGIGIGVGASGTWTYNVLVTNCTITGNTTAGNVAASAGGGISRNQPVTGSLIINYSIVAGNNTNSTSASKDITSATGFLTSDTGRNLFGGVPSWGTSTTTGNVNLTADISTILNTTLADNGGSTALPDGTHVKTHALLDGCAAINPAVTGLDIAALRTSLTLPITDQRVYSRDATPDMGAYEFGGITTGLVQSTIPQAISVLNKSIVARFSGLVEVFNFNGVLVKNIKVSEGETIALPTGAYIVRSATKDGVSVQKVIL